jgi:hypothetical protein
MTQLLPAGTWVSCPCEIGALDKCCLFAIYPHLEAAISPVIAHVHQAGASCTGPMLPLAEMLRLLFYVHNAKQITQKESKCSEKATKPSISNDNTGAFVVPWLC